VLGIGTDLLVHRNWTDDPGLLPALRELFTYDSEGRANGYLYHEGAQPWPASFAQHGERLLVDLERALGVRFMIALYQAYLDGAGVHWHTDEGYDVQAILSLGVTRTFGTRRTDGDPVWTQVDHGDLLVMPPGFQSQWQHCVPVEDVPGERCSLVFRAVAPNN
jgi:alkylated DNA repair dioxygenase AlkB